MKPLKKSFKLIYVFVSILICLQSCRVYHHDNVSLADAAKSEKRIKIKTKTNEVVKYKKVIIENGEFYGVKTKKGKLIKTILDSDKINKVRLHNKPFSIVYGALIAIISAVFIAYTVAIGSFGGI